MNKIIKALLPIFILSIFSSCQNNGNIGDWYGMWKLQSITIDGVDDPEYEPNVFWKFQTGVIQMVRYSETSGSTGTGTWKEKNGILELTYEYSDNSNPEASRKYSTLSGMHLPATGVIPLEITKKPSSSMILTYRAEDGTNYVYTFKKW